MSTIDVAINEVAIFDISLIMIYDHAERQDKRSSAAGRGRMEIEPKLEELGWQGNTPIDVFLQEQGAVMRAAKTALQRRVGISDTRLHILGLLYVLGEVSQAELQRRLDVDGASVTRQVKQLESDGLLSRRADPADNRFTLVMLTEGGKQRLREVARAARKFLNLALEGVSEEDLSCMRRAMARVRANLEKM